MLTFMGLETDPQPLRAAKLKALQAHFNTTEPTAFHMLGDHALSKDNNGGSDLIINSHGNSNVFAGYDEKAFCDLLFAKGLENGSFKAIYLMACSVGEQTQQGDFSGNFAVRVKRILTQSGISTKLYAPRGYLTYTVSTETKSTQEIFVVQKMFIRSPEKDYPLSEGLLLVQ